jgi:predicted ferric reductase
MIASIKANKVAYLVFLSCLLAFVPFLSYDGEFNQNGLIFLFANITGMLGILLLFWSLLLGNRFVSKLISLDVKKTLSLHKQLGKYGVVFVLIHPLLEMLNYLENFSWLYTLDFSTTTNAHISLGRLAIGLYLIVWISSAVLRKKLKYRPWLFIHYLSYPMLWFSLFHIQDIGTFTNSILLLNIFHKIAVLSFWIIILTRVWFFAGFFKSKYTLKSVEELADNVFTITLSPVGKKIIPFSGQFIYLQYKNFTTSHPYSIMHFDKKTGEIVLGIKSVGKHSQKVKQLKAGATVKLDGAYGVFTNEPIEKNPRIYYAGGIGITPFIDAILENNQTQALFCGVNYADSIVYKSELQAKLGENFKVFTTLESKNNKKITRQDVEDFVKNFGVDTDHFICGGPMFMKSIKQILKELHVPQNKIFTEEFSN